jgi:hypothetical protein
MLLFDVFGKAGIPSPAQIVSDVPKSKTGLIFGFTVTLKLVVVAHCPVFEINV